MTEEKEKIWEEATKKSYAENANGTNWDRISIAMDLYAESEVKKLKQAHVRGQLLAFLKWLQKQDMSKAMITLVDEYEQASNLP